jgi:hypothetical protein
MYIDKGSRLKQIEKLTRYIVVVIAEVKKKTVKKK